MIALFFFVAVIGTIVYLSRKVLSLKQDLAAKELDSRFDDAWRQQLDSRTYLERKLDESTKYLESNWQQTLDVLDSRLGENIAVLDRKVDENVAELQRRINQVRDDTDKRLYAVLDEVNDLKAKKSSKK